MKKIISLVLIMFLILIITSCASENDLNLIISGDLNYMISEGNTAIIMGLSKEGKTKKAVTIPAYIDGYKVSGVGFDCTASKASPPYVILELYMGDKRLFESDVLEYVYLESPVRFNNVIQFLFCPFLRKIIYVGKEPLLPPKEQSNHFSYFNEHNSCPRFILCNLLEDGEQIENDGLYEEANVVYKLNYETTGRDFYDLDSTLGSLIKPQDPTREGYTFKGWYTEPECINEWDFENDEVTKYSEYIEINEEDGKTKKYSVIVKTYLYAKWEEIKEA